MPTTAEANSRLVHRDDAILLVIDVQERLLPHIAGGEALVANIAKLVQFARIIGLPVVVTEQVRLGPTVAGIAQHLADVEPITKAEFGCLGCEGFTERLTVLGRNTLILTGIEAHICVAQTALQALDHYTVHVVRDAVGSRCRANRRVALDRMREAGVVITSTEMVMYELLARAGTDEFRAVLPLVKGG